jgi:hypothetical protein
MRVAVSLPLPQERMCVLPAGGSHLPKWCRVAFSRERQRGRATTNTGGLLDEECHVEARRRLQRAKFSQRPVRPREAA